MEKFNNQGGYCEFGEGYQACRTKEVKILRRLLRLKSGRLKALKGHLAQLEKEKNEYVNYETRMNQGH